MASDTHPLTYTGTKESNRKRIDAFNKECVANGLNPRFWAGGYVGVDSEGREIIRLSWPKLKTMSIAEIREHVRTESVLWCFR